MAIVTVTKRIFREHLNDMLADERTTPLTADVISFIINKHNPIKAARHICSEGAFTIPELQFYFQAHSFFMAHEVEIVELLISEGVEEMHDHAEMAAWAIEHTLHTLLSEAKLI